jgi:hypothetical protein
MSTRGFAEGYPGYQGFVFNSYQSFLFNGGKPNQQDPNQKINLTKPRVLKTLEFPTRFGSDPTLYPTAGSLTFYDGNNNVFRLQFTDEAAIQKLGPSLNAWVQNPGTISLWCNGGGVVKPVPNYVVFIVKGDGKYDFSKNEKAVPVGECKISDFSTIVPNQ